MNQKKYPPVHKALKKYYGYDSFRPGQLDLICAMLDGRDVLGIMPTGAGKSVCYQIPAVFMKGITLVISPLISLMKDQVTALLQAGIPAAYLNSSLTSEQYRKALYFASQGKYKIIYVAPERLMTPAFQQFVQNVDISMIAIDEAHCVSQWGQNFRPSYLDIAEFASTLPHRPVMAAFTATATGPVKDDIMHMLNLQSPRLLVTGFDRPNLYFEVKKTRRKFEDLVEYLEEHPGESGIIYCLTRKETEEVCQKLCDQGFPCTRYHAGLDELERSKNQDDFQYDRVPLITATSAFGMGINKSNIRFVIHYSMPSSLESYYQEAGRAGRDGAPGECILFYSAADIMTNKFLIEKSNEENPEQLSRDMHRLNQMDAYCKTPLCLRSYILQYFGEASSGTCDNCSNCNGDWVEENITLEAATIYKALREMPRPYGMATVRDFLKGKDLEKLRSSGLTSLPSHGALKAKSADEIMLLLESLAGRGYLERSSDRWQVVYPTPLLHKAVMEKTDIIVRRKPDKAYKQKKSIIPSKAAQAVEAGQPYESGLFDLLKKKRKELASEKGLPPYMIFSDATLMEMAKTMPLDKEELLEVHGVGQVKLDQYGSAFLGVISNYLSDAS